MAKVNRIEAEIDAIRDKICEETKHMTREEKAKRVMDIAQEAATQYGFVIQPSANTNKVDKAV